MRFYPTKIHVAFLCLILVSVSINLGCSKDSDLILDSVIEESTSVLEQRENSTPEEQNTEEESVAEENIQTEDSSADSLESRTSSFSPTNDAHFQSGKGYNQNIIRLEEGHRTSYLMFDMSPIEAIGGTISKATLQFTINSDDGNGNISVYKGKSNNWTEESLSDSNIPETDVLIGSITKDYKIGTTEIIDLETSNIIPEVSTLVLDHKNGNDLAFASKEHASKIGPKLVVTYDVPVGTEEIVITEEETTEEETTEEETTEEETTEEETTEEETTEDSTTDNKEPMAVADATPPSGGVPLEVSFTGSNSTDDTGITSYLWDFKDGSNATTANPKHTFTTAGVYKVMLTVKDEKGLSSTDEVTITVTEKENEAPKAVVSATPVSGEAPLVVSFKGSNSTDDNSIATYGWDFKDGSKTNRADFTYTYTKPGVYEAELTVKDENGLEDKETITITVTEPKNEAPVAILSANPTSGVAPLDVQFLGDKSTDDVGITSYSWDFKDGTSASTSNPSHKFTQAGTYEVEFTVKDKEGLSDKKTIVIAVTAPQNQPPVAVLSANPTSGDAPLNVQFVGNNSTDDKAVTSYFWDFKDGTSANTSNPSHTFSSAGNYVVELTVKDAEGVSSSKTVTINVTSPSTGNAPPGFYVATNGSASNNGTSPSSPWSLEHAINVAKGSDIIYVKAGNYGNKQLLSKRHGNSGSPIKFIGYRSTPGDIVSSQGSTFNIGESVNASKMPLLNSSNGQGAAITLYHQNIHFENFQITGYRTGVSTIDLAKNVTFKNVIVTKVGRQNVNGYDGFGFSIKGNNTLLENCFVLNATAEAINLFDSDNSRINYCKVYANNSTNPTDYYFLLTGGTNNTVIENSLADRAQYLSHGGHGFTMKDLAQHNTIRNCTARKTNIEFNFSGVKYNTVDNCSIYGVDTTSSNWHAGVVVFNGANNNLVKNTYIQDTWRAISWGDYDDGYQGPGGDRDEVSLGYDNTFDNITVKNTNRIVNVGGGNNFSAKASRNKFTNCDFTDFQAVAVTFYKSENILFQNCKFKNGQKLVVEHQAQYAPYSHFDVTWQNCTWTNVNFNPPN
ncbi:PKD domain-containing protein [Maribacter algarum]|uniref:PKD domain-containing protein n=1 Tax=Maribacter algarum (ex Zhang et al. 2020) TaxID=2578118 RepID=A0A5S3Q9Q9_9FLAO|nr:PKD domain-containing protein [Maribacter algarum]TMM53783.1 PKD domain-containing protein [Maribacter algarum]